MSEKQIQSPQPEQLIESTLPIVPNEKTDFKPIALGCFFGLFSFLVIFIGLGVFVITPQYSTSSTQNISIYGGWVVLSAIVAFSAGSYVFLRWAVPKTKIRNFGRLPNITIARKHPKGGLKNLTVTRILVSVITCTLVYLVVLLVWFFIGAIIPQDQWPIFSSILTIATPLIGLILGPIIAILIYSRTSTS